jgi:DNA-binding CsgD family transcriptional regulator
LRHRAYNAYAAAGDELGAGGTAARLAVEHFLRDEPSVGAGFLMRARRHVEGVAEGPELGFLAMVDEAAFERAMELGDDPQPGLALLRLSQRKVEAARTALRSALAAERHPPRRARLLGAQVEAALAAGAVDEARAAADELGSMADGVDLPAFEAAAATAAGAVALAEGDVPAALDALRRATATWQNVRLPYEAARARTLLGRALLAGGDEEGARRELRGALAAFEGLGAARDVADVREVLEGRRALPAGLTAREAEVLRLVAAGKTNRDIAVELVISEHTVARHLQNMFAKLGVSSRAAATAFAFEHGLA